MIKKETTAMRYNLLLTFAIVLLALIFILVFVLVAWKLFAV